MLPLSPPPGLVAFLLSGPTTCAVGCILSPLRGFVRVNNREFLEMNALAHLPGGEINLG